jgi:hypothetical protein
VGHNGCGKYVPSSFVLPLDRAVQRAMNTHNFLHFYSKILQNDDY